MTLDEQYFLFGRWMMLFGFIGWWLGLLYIADIIPRDIFKKKNDS